MILEITIALLLGVISGTITGLAPGIHINLVAAFLLSLTSVLVLNPLIAAVFIVSMAITHTFLDFIPSAYLGAPDEDTALSVLPAHELLMKGRGHEAVMLTLIGSAMAIVLAIVITPIFILVVPLVNDFINRMMAWILVWAAVFMVYREKNSRLWAVLIFLLAGFLGLATLNLPMQQPLLPLLGGLFGASTLILSISQHSSVPPQKLETFTIKKSGLIKPAIATALVSPICSFLPGLGSSEAAIIASGTAKELSREQFLVLVGSINTLVMAMSFVTLYTIQKARSGAAAAIQQLLNISLSDIAIFFAAMLVASAFSFFLAVKISKTFARNVNKINYGKTSAVVLAFITLIVFLFSGWLGLLVFSVSAVLGLLCTSVAVRKGFLMGSLIAPAILFYFPF